MATGRRLRNAGQNILIDILIYFPYWKCSLMFRSDSDLNHDFFFIRIIFSIPIPDLTHYFQSYRQKGFCLIFSEKSFHIIHLTLLSVGTGYTVKNVNKFVVKNKKQNPRGVAALQ